MNKYNEVKLIKEHIEEAQIFAENAHGLQKYDEFFYIKHLKDVYSILVDFGYSPNTKDGLILLVAAYLHDILEDCAVSYSDLKKRFGFDVAETVYCMTDEMGRTRKEKKEKTYPKIRSNLLSITLKLADRIANFKHSLSKADAPSILEMYVKENENFQQQLRIHNHIPEMWEYLDSLVEEAKRKTGLN